MTVSSSVSKLTYDGDGTTVFATGFLFNAKADVTVIHRDAANVETTWVENTQYTLSGVGNPTGGNVIVKTTPTDYTPLSGEKLTIKRVVPRTQETDYPEGGEFPAKAHEDALDKLTFITHQLNEEIGRGLTAPETDDSSSLEIPNETARASKFLAFDAAGNPIAAAGTSANLTPVSSWINDNLLDDDSAATARATLGAQADLDVPSRAEAEAGTATDERVFTAQRVGQAIATLAPLALTPLLKSAAYSVVSADRGRLIEVDTSAGDVTITLPAAGDAANAGMTIGVVKTTSDTGKITVDGNAAELVGQTTTRVWNVQGTIEWYQVNNAGNGWNVVMSQGWHFESAQQTVASTTLSIAHPLPAKPTEVQVDMICISADQGYTAGDEIMVASSLGSYISVTGVTVGRSASDIFVVEGADIVPYNKTTQAATGADEAKWRYIARARL